MRHILKYILSDNFLLFQKLYLLLVSIKLSLANKQTVNLIEHSSSDIDMNYYFNNL